MTKKLFKLKQFVIIFLISLFSFSCERGEIHFLNERLLQAEKERDSLERLLSLTRLFCTHEVNFSSARFFIVGSESELLKKGVITRVSGLSREFKISNFASKYHFRNDHFQHCDTLEIRGKCVRILGCFHPDSYTLTGSDKEDYHLLTIHDQNRFWAQSFFLVITHK